MLGLTHIQVLTGVLILNVGWANAQEVATCECVPYYLCKSQEIVTDGTDLINLKAANRASTNLANAACAPIETCCTLTVNASTIPPSPPLSGPSVLPSEGTVPPIPASVNIPLPSFCGVRRELPSQSPQNTGVSTGATHYAEFPWTIMILKKKEERGRVSYKLKCGGSLVHPQVVITAAQCVHNIAKESLRIRGGEWDQLKENEPLPHQDRKAQHIMVHPDFNFGNGKNDLAVIIVNSPFNITDNVDIICLPHSINFDYARCIVAGWGKDSYDDGNFKQVLRKVETRVLPAAECQMQLRTTLLGRHFVLDESFICTEGGGPGKDTCLGDGGSPLVCPLEKDPMRWVQVGIVSWGIGCGEGNPAVYTRLSKFVNWIIDKVPSDEKTPGSDAGL